MNAKTRHGEEPADNFFREDALRLGYLTKDGPAPGSGRGLRAYYRDHDMVQPEEYREQLAREVPVSTLGDNDNLSLEVARNV